MDAMGRVTRWVSAGVLAAGSLVLLAYDWIALAWLASHLTDFKPWETLLVVLGIVLPPAGAMVWLVGHSYVRVKANRDLAVVMWPIALRMLVTSVGLLLFWLVAYGMLGGSFLF